MKVLQVTAYDSVGEQFNGLVLHRAMAERGVRSGMLVYERTGSDPDVEEIAGRRLRAVNRYAQALEEVLSLYAVLPVAGLGIYRSPLYQAADLVHLQLMHGLRFFSLLQLPRLSREKAIVWTVHDPWLTTGHCVHPMDCQRWMTGCGLCPNLTAAFALRRDRTALNWRIKRWCVEGRPITLVFASKWMRERAAASPILRGLPSEVIPFGVDPSVFNPGHRRAAREALGIPPDAPAIAMRAMGWEGAFKGTDFAEEALRSIRFSQQPYLIVFQGQGGLDSLRGHYRIIELGWVSERLRVAQALAAADLFLMPSIAETFGVMAVEAMACGVPVVCFEGTALPDVIGAPASGVAVAHRDAGPLHRAIAGLMDNRERRLAIGDAALQLVGREYTLARYVDRHVELYRRLVASRAGSPQGAVSG